MKIKCNAYHQDTGREFRLELYKPASTDEGKEQGGELKYIVLTVNGLEVEYLPLSGKPYFYDGAFDDSVIHQGKNAAHEFILKEAQ